MEPIQDTYPIDFGSLSKGSWIETVELEQAFGIKCTDGPPWNFALMGLKQQIEQRVKYLCRIDHDRIRVMDDHEADEYLVREQHSAERKILSTAMKRTLIDRRDFSDAERSLADHRDRMSQAMAMAVIHERKKRRLLGSFARPKQIKETL